MDILYLLIPISLVLIVLAALGFWWALDRGQFDDLDVPAHAILLDDDRSDATRPAQSTEKPQSTEK